MFYAPVTIEPHSLSARWSDLWGSNFYRNVIWIFQKRFDRTGNSWRISSSKCCDNVGDRSLFNGTHGQKHAPQRTVENPTQREKITSIPIFCRHRTSQDFWSKCDRVPCRMAGRCEETSWNSRTFVTHVRRAFAREHFFFQFFLSFRHFSYTDLSCPTNAQFSIAVIIGIIPLLL